MPPIPITLHITLGPTSHRHSGKKPLTPVSPLPPALTASSEHGDRPAKPHPRWINTHPQVAFVKTGIPLDVLAGSGPDPAAAHKIPSPPASEISVPASQASASSSSVKRRKAIASNAGNIRGASLTPLLRPIVYRCLASVKSPGSGPSTPIISPPFSAMSKRYKFARSRAEPSNTPMVHPYSRLTDLGNNRSSVPSPREIVRAERVELEKAKAKKESAALARAAVAAKRKRGPKAKGDKAVPVVGLGGSTRESSPVQNGTVPVITTELASSETSEAPPLDRIPMKRTRSQGLLSISTSAANAIGTANFGAGSPLRAVTGPEEADAESEADDPPRKRQKSRPSDSSSARLSGSAIDSSPLDGTAPLPRPLRVKSLSPRGTEITLPTAEPGTTPGQLDGGRPVPKSRRSGSVNTVGGTAMRRVVSASTLDGRRDSVGSEESTGTRERLKREVTIPARLRDYDTRVGAI